MSRDTRKALALGLKFRPVTETIAATRDFLKTTGKLTTEKDFGNILERPGLTPELERELLRDWHAQNLVASGLTGAYICPIMPEAGSTSPPAGRSCAPRSHAAGRLTTTKLSSFAQPKNQELFPAIRSISARILAAIGARAFNNQLTTT